MFKKIDFNNWGRTEKFEQFVKIAPCDYNITANLDITQLLAVVKEKKIKLYSALIFMLTKAVNEIEEMRLGYNQDNELGYFELCHPSYTIKNAIETSFSGIWTYAKENFAEFYSDYLNDTKEYSTSMAYAPKDNQPQNTFYVSCIPEISFTSLNLNLYKGANNFTPMFTWGKYFEQGEKIFIPLAARFHHAACDGFHVALLYKKVQKLADTAEKWLVF